MRIVRKRLCDLSSNDIEEIGSFLNSHLSTVFHEPDFNKIVEEAFNTEFSYYLAYNDKGELIALCPQHSIKNGILTRTYSNPAIYEVPYGGWIYDITKVSFPKLINQKRISFNESLTYWSIPQIVNDDYKELQQKRIFQTAIIDLNLSEDAIFDNCLSANKRSRIRRAMRKGVCVKMGGIEYFEEFYKTFIAMKGKTGLTKYPKEYYQKIIEHYSHTNKCKIFLSEINHTLLSGIVTIGNKYLIHYWLGGMLDINKNLYQNDYIHWEAIKWAKESGSRYYDLCVVEPERLPNIARFKLGFSKRIVPFYCITKRKIGYRAISRIKRCL